MIIDFKDDCNDFTPSRREQEGYPFDSRALKRLESDKSKS